jgi:hypothetical protein
MTLIVAGAPLRAREPLERHYMLIFAAQVDSNDPTFSHTFATFVKTTATGESASDGRTEAHTISWMPQSLHIVILGTSPEPGTNLDLQSSLRWAESRNCRVSMWGPYKIGQELYDRAIKQESRLKTGRVLYKAMDRAYRPGIASNCIHAVSDLDPDRGLLDAGQLCGDAASRRVVQHLNHWIIGRGQSHSWVAGRLGLKLDHVSPRDYEQRLLLVSR